MNESSFIANAGNFTFPDKAKMQSERLFFRLPLDRINWLTSSFLIGTLALALTAVPLYLWFFGLDWFLWTLSNLGLVRNLLRVPADKIRSAQRETGERVACAPAGRNALK